MMLPIGRAVLAAAILGVAGPALAQAVAPPGPVPGPRTGPYIAYGPVCDRAALRDCQAKARLVMSLCDPFPGRFACADRVLAEQSACWAATGCD
ncbi:hypothetical protein [Enterovirga aerilata]|uniref:Uncharacterized protein n=1 Tax=Enterovirga aerilata TaxID=2730920 RepID=A0A849IAR1_9HYPH|nr:hypothetical protein [Enterovirga sp. DB1703]NNM74984.1 hypothetical protein [Enterovirga sp. DB1703]